MQDAPMGDVRAGIERVKGKLGKAKDVLGQVTRHVESHADSVIGKGDDVMNHADKAFAPHYDMLKDTDKGLDELDDALKVMMGNGGPLPPSNG
jgi:hypothetical protein